MHFLHTFTGCFGFFTALFGLGLLLCFCIPLKSLIKNVKYNAASFFTLAGFCLLFIILGSWIASTTYSKSFALKKIGELLTDRTFIETRLEKCKIDAANASVVNGMDLSVAFNYEVSEYQKRYEKNEEKLRYWYDRATKDEN